MFVSAGGKAGDEEVEGVKDAVGYNPAGEDMRIHEGEQPICMIDAFH